MNARGETLARLLLFALAGNMGYNAVELHQSWAVFVVFICGFVVAKAPYITNWIESRGIEDAGGDTHAERHDH